MPLADNSSYSSPNWSPRSGRPIRMLVIHATAGTARESLKWLSTPLSQSSAHYLIDKTGRVYELVSEDRMAWHAGGCYCPGIDDVDDVSIGIELENNNTGSDPYPPEQIDTLLEVAGALVEAYGIEPEHVVRHADIAVPAGREIDPAGFPWEYFMAQLFPGYRVLTPPAYPLPQIAPDTLQEACRETAYRQIGVSYRPSWAVFRIAAQLNLGSPVMECYQVTIGGRTFVLQPFGRDVLLAPLGEWEMARKLSQVPDDRETTRIRMHFTQALYERVGSSYDPDGPFELFAEHEPLGPPLYPPFQFRGERYEYEALIYGIDTIFTPLGSYPEIGRLSSLTRGMFDRRPPQLEQEELFLREELLVELYRRAGASYHAEWPLHRRAIQWGLGTPLAQPVRCSFGGRDYITQPYALDVLYCQIGDWSHVERVGA